MINKDLRVEVKGIRGNWKDVYRACLNTIGKETNREPSSEWKKKILMSEHSPIRKINVEGKWDNLYYWVSNHFVRHKYGIEHFVSTQRTDRTDINRNEKTQNSFVKHEFDCNIQSIINISRKRLCKCASDETREAWIKFLDELNKVEPEIVSVCVPECIYRNGLCPEFYSCGYNKTRKFEEELKVYVENVKGQINEKCYIGE